MNHSIAKSLARQLRQSYGATDWHNTYTRIKAEADWAVDIGNAEFYRYSDKSILVFDRDSQQVFSHNPHTKACWNATRRMNRAMGKATE